MLVSSRITYHYIGLERYHMPRKTRDGIDRSKLAPADPEPASEPKIADEVDDGYEGSADDNDIEQFYFDSTDAPDDLQDTGDGEIIVEPSYSLEAKFERRKSRMMRSQRGLGRKWRMLFKGRHLSS